VAAFAAGLPSPARRVAGLDTAARRSLDRLLGLWDDLVDPEVGIVREVYPLGVDNDEPDFFHYLSAASDTSVLTAMRNFAQNGGVSTNPYVAMAKALGEAIERYCAAQFRYDELVVAPYGELGAPATPPDSYALYRADQYGPDLPWQPFTDTTPVAWTPATDVLSGEEVLVPACMVYAPYHYLGEGREQPIVQPISTGLAAGCSPAEATLSGLCEVIERDAFSICWQARLAHRRISRAGLDAAAVDMLGRFERVGVDVELLDITTDVACPTVMSIALGHAPTSPALAIAAAAHPDPRIALTKCVEELAHTRKFARQIMQYEPPIDHDPSGRWEHVQEQRHHLRLHCDRAAVAHSAWAWSSPTWVRLADVAGIAADSDGALVTALAERLAALGHRCYVVDLTTSDVASLGLAVHRVVVPGLHPMFIGHPNRALGGERLYAVPPRLGFSALARDGDDNPFPHPFP